MSAEEVIAIGIIIVMVVKFYDRSRGLMER